MTQGGIEPVDSGVKGSHTTIAPRQHVHIFFGSQLSIDGFHRDVIKF